jgi:hypothetical protein
MFHSTTVSTAPSAASGRDQHEQQKIGRMQHAGDWAFGASAYIGRRPGDGAGDRHAAEYHRADIGKALGHKLAIGAAAAARHAVGDHGREQRLDRAGKRDGRSVRDHGAKLGEAERRRAGRRQGAPQAAKAGSNSGHVERKQPCKYGGGGDRDQKGRPGWPPFAHAKNDEKGEGADLGCIDGSVAGRGGLVYIRHAFHQPECSAAW